MKAKDKAKSLVDVRLGIINSWLNSVGNYDADKLSKIELAKQCALICVDEILKELDNFGNDDGYQFTRVEYWQQVKQEINKL
jgi:hypothetical protein